MKQLLYAFIFCLSLFASGYVQADCASLPVNVKEETRKAVNGLKKLSREQREAALAEIAGLLFMPDGRRVAYSTKTSIEKVAIKQKDKVVRVEGVPFRRVVQGAVFVRADGRLYDFYAALPESELKKDTWKLAKLNIHHAGKATILKRFKPEVDALECQRAIYFLRELHPDIRQSLFAEMLGLLYMEDGSDVFSGKTLYEQVEDERIPHKSVRRGTKFRNAEGVTCGYYEVKDEATRRGDGWKLFWKGIKLAIHHQGKDEIFAPFKSEIQALKTHAAE